MPAWTNDLGRVGHRRGDLTAGPNRGDERSPLENADGNRRLFGTLVIAVLLILIPSATGFVLLRQQQMPLPTPGAIDDVRVVGDASAASEIVSSDDLLQPKPVVRSERPRIRYLMGDEPVAIPNGGAIPLADDLRLEVFTAPYPPTSLDVDVDLYLTTTSGTPVTDATMSVVYDMIFMSHGPFVAAFTNIGGGHYVAPFDFFMYGPWELLIEADVPDHGRIDELALSIYVWPEG